MTVIGISDFSTKTSGGLAVYLSPLDSLAPARIIDGAGTGLRWIGGSSLPLERRDPSLEFEAKRTLFVLDTFDPRFQPSEPAVDALEARPHFVPQRTDFVAQLLPNFDSEFSDVFAALGDLYREQVQ